MGRIQYTFDPKASSLTCMPCGVPKDFVSASNKQTTLYGH